MVEVCILEIGIQSLSADVDHYLIAQIGRLDSTAVHADSRRVPRYACRGLVIIGHNLYICHCRRFVAACIYICFSGKTLAAVRISGYCCEFMISACKAFRFHACLAAGSNALGPD